LAREIADELAARKRAREHKVLEAFRDRRVVLLALVYLLAITGALANIYWIPTFVKRLSGGSITAVTSLLMIPAFIGIVGTLLNGWHSDRSAERRLHTVVPLLAAAVLYCCVIIFRADPAVAVACLLAGSGVLYAFYPVFWSLPTMILSE